MRWNSLLAIAACVLLGGMARADDDDSISQASWNRNRWGVAPLFCPPCQPNPYYAPNTMPSTLPNPNDPNAPPVPNPDLTNPFATATPGGGLQGRSFNENFDGDFSGAFYSKTIVVGYTSHQVVVGTNSSTVVSTITTFGQFLDNGQRQRFTTTTSTTTTSNIYGTVTDPVTRVVRVPVSGEYSGILITDNDSPRPTDRVYFGYNYYSGLGYSMNPGFGNVNENREMVGFEKTFLDGNASFGMRLPFIQYSGPFGLDGQTTGDLSILFKYAFINDLETGNVASVGLIITTPTSALGGELSDGSPVPHSVLFQPWAGFIWMFDRAYVQGITDLIVPTNGRDTLLWTNSLATGYWVYQDLNSRWLNGIIPTAEIHVHTPLNNRNSDGFIYVPDEVNVTAGVHWRFPRVTLSTSVGVPLVGPRPYNVEAIANLNFAF
jgi:hypothetical protein